MDTTLIYTVVALCVLGAVAAVALYFVASKFKVYEDPRIDEVEALLPSANCGGCGYPGCRGFADAIVRRGSLEGFYCTAGGQATMDAIAAKLGLVAEKKEPMVAVVRCAGSCDKRPRTNKYVGERKCSVASALYGGETNCSYGCLGFGDCVEVCPFDAIHMNKDTGLPVVDQDKCTACGKCVAACPNIIIELRRKGPKDRRVFVSCVNKAKGAVAKKACDVACIACGKCVKACPFEAIEIKDNLAYIDYNKCKLCRKCVPECPTGAIWEVNFPPKKVVDPVEVRSKAEIQPKGESLAQPVKQSEAVDSAKAEMQQKAEPLAQTVGQSETEGRPKAESEIKVSEQAEIKETSKAEPRIKIEPQQDTAEQTEKES